MATEAKTLPEIEAPKSEPSTVNTTPTVTEKLIVAKRKFDRWYVYFKGVAPKDNVGCGCKTAKSAIRYMYLLRSRYGAVISQDCYESLKAEAEKEA